LATKSGRITKHQLKEDLFVTRTFQIAGYFRRHQNQVVLVAAGAVFLVAVALLLVRFQAGSRRASALELSTGVGMFQAGNYQEAAYRLSTFLESHSRHKDTAFAALLAADANFYLSRWEDAGRYYRTALEKTEEKSGIWFAARMGLASVEEGLGRSIEAARVYEELAGMEEDPVSKSHMIFSAIRAYRQGGEIAKASELLETLDTSQLDPIDQANFDVQRTALQVAASGEQAADSR
jgi:tetratricopeptide (TPR) repeat protein